MIKPRLVLISVEPGGVVDANSFHMSCVVHAAGFAVKQCTGKTSDKILKIRKLVSALRCSVKKYDLFWSVRKILNVKFEL